MNELVNNVNQKVSVRKKKSIKINFDDDLSSDQCMFGTSEVERI